MLRGPPPRRPGRPAGAAWGRTFEAAFEAGISVVVGVVAGYYADRWLGTLPLFTLVLMVLGGVAAVRRLLQLAKSVSAGEPTAAQGSAQPEPARPAGSAAGSPSGAQTPSDLSGPSGNGPARLERREPDAD